MQIFDNLLSRFGYAKTATITDPPAWLMATGEAERHNMTDRAIPARQSELYQRLSWVQTAVSITANTSSSSPLRVLQMQGEDTDQIDNHPFEQLLMRPNPLYSRSEFLVATFSHQNLTGNAYWWLNRSNENAAPDEMWLLPSHQVEPVPDGNMFIKGYLYDPGGGLPEMLLEPWEIAHFKRFHPLSWYQGLSPIEALATISAGDLAMQKWNTNLFAENNAKLPGALAFRDAISDPEWAKMKADIIREHGGTKRSLMMLRGVGDRGVEWVPMAMSSSDMEFLDGRTANKEEIYGMYSPGLASMLAVNATEANSTAGKATFLEFACWPQMTAVAEKMTNDILPSYGDNLVCRFDDIRQSDRQIEIAQQTAAARVQTIDEIRQTYYQLEPLDDGRGELMIGETPVVSAVASDVLDGDTTGDILGYHIESGTVTRNEARAKLGLPEVDESKDQLVSNMKVAFELMTLAQGAGVDPAFVARQLGIDESAIEPEPEPAPAQLPPPPEEEPEPDDDEAEKRRETKTLKRYLSRGNRDPADFDNEHLTDAEVLQIAEGEGAAPDAPFRVATWENYP